MWIYIICFFCSALLLYFSKKVKYSFYRKVLIFIALLLPCLLAGARSLKIGTDTNIYVTPMYDSALRTTSFSNFLNSKIQLTRCVKDFELGFSFLVYITAQLFHNIHILLFLIEAMIIFPLYFGIKKIKALNGEEWFAMLIYYFLFYNQGLNAMRQFISISICVYGICSVISKEKRGLIKYIISLIIAYLFHKSALISLSLVLVYYTLNKKKNKQKYIKYKEFKIPIKVLISIIVIIMGFYIVFNMQIISNLLYGIEGLERYKMYSANSITIFDLNFTKVLPMIILMIIKLKKFYQKYDDCLFYVITFCFGYIIFGQLINVAKYSSRISLLYTNFSCITYTLLPQCSDTRKNKMFSRLFIFSYVLFMWWYSCAYRGYYETIPYVFG